MNFYKLLVDTNVNLIKNKFYFNDFETINKKACFYFKIKTSLTNS